jgi:hypothetical protein
MNEKEMAEEQEEGFFGLATKMGSFEEKRTFL